VLKRMLAYASVARPEEFSELKDGHLAAGDSRDTITVVAGLASWTVRPAPREVVVTDGGSTSPRVAIEGPPAQVLRWLWGRAGDDTVRLTGDPAWADYLRRMLAAVTG
jgi:MDMPI C-terminal domain